MTETNVYIKISRKSPKPGKGSYMAILEAMSSSGKPATLTIKGTFENITPHKLELRAIVDTLHRYKTQALVNIHSDHGWFKTVRDNGWFDKWHEDDWMKDGEPIACWDLYREIDYLEKFAVEIGSIDTDLGEYKTWLESQIKTIQ